MTSRAEQVERLARRGLSPVEISVRLMMALSTVKRLMPQGIPGPQAGVDGRKAGRGMARTEATAVTGGRDRHPHSHGPTCRWIEGDPSRPGWSFCGAPAVTGVVQGDGMWCAAHRARVYVKPHFHARKSPEQRMAEAGAV